MEYDPGLIGTREKLASAGKKGLDTRSVGVFLGVSSGRIAATDSFQLTYKPILIQSRI